MNCRFMALVFGGFTVFYKFCDVILLFHFHSGELNQDAEKEGKFFNIYVLYIC